MPAAFCFGMPISPNALATASAGLLEASPAAFRHKYRTMAADPFAFYRGSASVFYADMRDREDPWVDERTARVWIQGDLHAQNFGTYMDGAGHDEVPRLGQPRVVAVVTGQLTGADGVVAHEGRLQQRVLDDGKPVGVLTRQDLLGFLAGSG